MPVAPAISRTAGACPPRRTGVAWVQMQVSAGENNIPRMARLVAHTRQPSGIWA
jgi:hypothetical protein